MSRNSGGSYSLPAGNPVTGGTPITATWQNTLGSDLATEMTDSLSRSGKGGMLSAIRGIDGTVAAPAISFTTETGTGFFRESAGVMKGVILGVYRLLLQATGAVVNGTFGIRNPTATKTVTLDAGASLAADYTLTFPTALPASTLPVNMSSAGALTAAALSSKAALPSVGQQVSSASGTFTGNSATYADVTNLNVSITTTGRPIFVMLVPGGSTMAYLGATNGGGTGGANFALVLGASTVLAEYRLSGGAVAGTATIRVPPSALSYVYVVGAGTYALKVQAKQNAGGDTYEASDCKLLAFEL